MVCFTAKIDSVDELTISTMTEVLLCWPWFRKTCFTLLFLNRDNLAISNLQLATSDLDRTPVCMYVLLYNACQPYHLKHPKFCMEVDDVSPVRSSKALGFLDTTYASAHVLSYARGTVCMLAVLRKGEALTMYLGKL